MAARDKSILAGTSLDRRSLLKRAGILGISLPAAGMLMSACGGTDVVDERILAATKTPEAVGASQGAAVADDDTDDEPVDAQSGDVTELTVTAKDLFFEPDMLEIPAGELVRVIFVNEGAMEHDWEVIDLKDTDLSIIEAPPTMTPRMEERLALAESEGIPYAGGGPGESMTIEFTAHQGGQFSFFCMVPGHKEAGMVGILNVTGGEGEQAGDDHVVTAPESAVGEPYDAPRLPNPEVAPPVTHREPQTIRQEIVIEELEGYVDEGVAHRFWTFGGTVPGPMVRVRVGDTVELTLTNPPESHATHNVDFHSATGPGGGAAVSLVAPGQSATFKFKALNPGVFVYHCATAPIPQHISSGMYGLMIVEPEDGLPPVDKEFYVMQGELYLEGGRGDRGLRTFSMDKMLDERPDYVVFNGSVGSITGDNMFRVNAGDTVRVFFGVGGPNLVSSFHIIGEIFDRVMIEGATEWSSNVQTTLVPAGGATIVEFTAEVPSILMMVDHSLGRLHKGCVGMIEVAGDENPEVFELISEAS